MSKKKLVLLISDFSYGGAQRQLATLAKELRLRDNYDLEVLYYYPGGALTQDLANAEIKVTCIPKGGRFAFVPFYLKLVQHLKQLQPDIVHGYLAIPNYFALAVKPWLPRTKIVWGMRGSGEGNSVPSNPIDFLLSKIEPFLSQFPDLIINNSHQGKNHYLKQNFPQEKMVVVPNGIDVKRFDRDDIARQQVRQELGIQDGQIAIGLVGRIHPMKDHPNFLNAAANLKEKYPDLVFLCVGSPEDLAYTAEVKQLGKELGLEDCLIWTGGRSDMPRIHNALDIAVSSSAYGEGFSNTVGEAMACGLPCVVTDVGDSAWIVGDLGLVAPPRNSQILAAKIAQTIDNLAHLERQQIRQRIIDRFSVEQLAINTEEALQQIPI